MIGRRSDVLSDYPLAKRLAKEQEDAKYIRDHPESSMSASKASLKRDNNTWAGVAAFAAKHFRPYKSGDKVDFIVCARIDLDHPLYFKDNKFAECIDCRCQLQYRPDVPKGEKICVCCCARRMREETK